ncbi:MAG TPA: hypothetical protein VH025_00660, partial [Solirubrobacteraceae bacterium]|nr:hypothetical protein [Solirubrobacteraceae bacterium]
MADFEPPILDLYGNFQYEIYGRGIAGEKPQLPISFDELERRAREELTPEAFGYVAGAAGSELTARANTEA